MNHKMKNIKFIFFFFLIFSQNIFSAQETYFKDLQPQPPATLRIASYNLFWKNGSCKPHKFNITTHIIKKIDADIILLQETTRSWKRCLNRELSHMYPYKKYKHHLDAGGLAILSKYPIKSEKYLSSMKHLRHPGWLLTAKTKFGNIEILNIHLRPSVDRQNRIGFLGHELFEGPSDRSQEMRYLYQYVSIHRPTIIAGDFNESYGSATLLLTYNGWRNALSLEDKDVSTWHWKVGPITLKQQYDKIFLSPHFRVINAQVLHEGLSDHYPVIVDLKKISFY